MPCGVRMPCGAPAESVVAMLCGGRTVYRAAMPSGVRTPCGAPTSTVANNKLLSPSGRGRVRKRGLFYFADQKTLGRVSKQYRSQNDPRLCLRVTRFCCLYTEQCLS